MRAFGPRDSISIRLEAVGHHHRSALADTLRVPQATEPAWPAAPRARKRAMRAWPAVAARSQVAVLWPVPPRARERTTRPRMTGALPELTSPRLPCLSPPRAAATAARNLRSWPFGPPGTARPGLTRPDWPDYSFMPGWSTCRGIGPHML
jgi:hypothetical protein